MKWFLFHVVISTISNVLNCSKVEREKLQDDFTIQEQDNSKNKKNCFLPSIMSWVDLPVDIIRLVACRLPCVVDFMRTRTVCRSWSKSLDIQQNFVPVHPPPIHVHALPRRNSTLSTYSPVTDSVRMIICRDMEGVDVIGSGYGWLVAEDGVNFWMVSTSPPARLRLPGRDGFRSDLFFTDPVITHLRRMVDVFLADLVNTRPRKIVIVHGSDAPSDFAAIAIFGHRARLAFARPRDQAWTTIFTSFDTYEDATVDEDGHLYAVTRAARVVIYRLSRVGVAERLGGAGVAERGTVIYPPQLLDLDLSMCRPYILTLEDRVYVIFRCCSAVGRTIQFIVRAIGLHGLMEVDGLQGHAIFVGRMTSSMSISTADFPQLIPNRIWFSDEQIIAEQRNFLDIGFCDTPAANPIYDMRFIDLPIPPHIENPVWNLSYPY